MVRLVWMPNIFCQRGGPGRLESFSFAACCFFSVTVLLFHALPAVGCSEASSAMVVSVVLGGSFNRPRGRGDVSHSKSTKVRRSENKTIKPWNPLRDNTMAKTIQCQKTLSWLRLMSHHEFLRSHEPKTHWLMLSGATKSIWAWPLFPFAPCGCHKAAAPWLSYKYHDCYT